LIAWPFQAERLECLIKLRHRDDVTFVHPRLQDVVIQKVGLRVNVVGLKTLAVSNDFGPVDTSKPFQPLCRQVAPAVD
jgi:hypothetical protein